MSAKKLLARAQSLELWRISTKFWKKKKYKDRVTQLEVVGYGYLIFSCVSKKVPLRYTSPRPGSHGQTWASMTNHTNQTAKIKTSFIFLGCWTNHIILNKHQAKSRNTTAQTADAVIMRRKQSSISCLNIQIKLTINKTTSKTPYSSKLYSKAETIYKDSQVLHYVMSFRELLNHWEIHHCHHSVTLHPVSKGHYYHHSATPCPVSKGHHVQYLRDIITTTQPNCVLYLRDIITITHPHCPVSKGHHYHHSATLSPISKGAPLRIGSWFISTNS